MKTIGVLGGLGPQATMDFENRVHQVSQRLIPQRFGAGYPPMVVVYFRDGPVLSGEDGKPIRPQQPDPALLEAAAQLGPLADFLVITSNGPHMFRPQIESAAGREVLSIIDVTLQEVKRRGLKRVGLMGAGVPLVYQIPMDELGIVYETLSVEHRIALDERIWAYMEGKGGPEAQRVARKAVDSLRGRGVDGIILGCTEIPLLLGADAQAADLINPAQLLAEAVVVYAMEANK